MALGASIAQATAEINAEAAEASRTSSPTCMSQASKASPSVVLSEVANPLDILDTLLDTVAGEECLKECEEAARRVAAADTASGLVDSKASSSAFGQHGAAAIVSPTVAASPPAAPNAVRRPTLQPGSATAIKSGRPPRPSTIADLLTPQPAAKRPRVNALAALLPLHPPSPKQPRLEPAASASETASGQVSPSVARRPAASDRSAKAKEAREAKAKEAAEAKAVAKAKNTTKLALYLQAQQVAKAYKAGKAEAPAPQP